MADGVLELEGVDHLRFEYATGKRCRYSVAR
jgi:hypothetical protein